MPLITGDYKMREVPPGVNEKKLQCIRVSRLKNHVPIIIGTNLMVVYVVYTSHYLVCVVIDIYYQRSSTYESELREGLI